MTTLSEVPGYVKSYWEKLRKIDREKYLDQRSEYMTAMMARDALVDRELGGDAHRLFSAETSDNVKQEYNRLSTRMLKIETQAMDSAVENVPEINLEFMRDPRVVVQTGWYQNAVGDLYHYDGVIWDNVPEQKVQELEFLGGN